MAGTFSDGFPLDPSSAVTAATFLTEQERNEWMSWLNSASPDDKAELVNTLHEIWIENKTQPAPVSQVQPVQTPAPVAPPAPVIAITPVAPVAPLPIPDLPKAPLAPVAPVVTQSAPIDAPKSQTMPPLPPKSAPTPLAQPPKPAVEQPKYAFKRVEESQDRPNRPTENDRRFNNNQDPRGGDRRPQPTQQDNRQQQARNDRPQESLASKPVTASNFVDLSKMQTDKTRSILDKFLKDFQQTRRTEEQSINQLKNAVLGVEEVVNYSDLLAEKILALNSAQMQSNKQAAKIQSEMSAKLDDVAIRIDDVQTMVERAQEEVDRLSRRQRAFEVDMKSMMSKVTEQLAGMGTDQFAGSDKVAILTRRLDRIEEVRGVRSLPKPEEQPKQAPVSESKPHIKSTFEQLAEMEVPTPVQTPKPRQEAPKKQPTQEVQPPNPNFMPFKLGGKGTIEE